MPAASWPVSNLIYHRLHTTPPPLSSRAMSQPTASTIPSRPTPPPPRDRRKLRIVCISDTHNTQLHLPPGDVLIHAGDMTNQGSYSELKKAVEWIGRAEHEVKIVIAGNHDGVTLDPAFHADYAAYFHNQIEQSHSDNLKLFVGAVAREKGIVYLNHEARRIMLKDGRTFKVFGSPWSLEHGLWGFGYKEPTSSEESLWNDIPLDTDVIITHGPPKYHLDTPHSGAPSSQTGCEYLRRALWAVRPVLHVFGHVHEARGVELVKWDLTSNHIRYKELSSTHIEDLTTGSKIFRVDLTKQGARGIETCLVNAAIASQRWRKGLGHVGRNKPVVVDVMADFIDVAQSGGLGSSDQQVRVRGVAEGWSEVIVKDYAGRGVV